MQIDKPILSKNFKTSFLVFFFCQGGIEGITQKNNQKAQKDDIK